MMSLEQYSRIIKLIGEEALQRLAASRVVVFGVGGVGSYAVEALARSGIGSLVLVDHDEVCLTDINRQLEALHSTVGRAKVEVVRERILDINPRAAVTVHQEFVGPENVALFLRGEITYIVDAIDNVTAKLAIIENALQRKIPVISAMGAGNKLDPAKLRISDISATSVCPLARVMRRELKKKGISHGLKVVYSTEEPQLTKEQRAAGRPPGSIAFVPSVAGLLMAGEVIRDIIHYSA